MSVSEPKSLVEHVATLKDPRMANKNWHELLDIVVIAVCGVICGADDWVSIEQFGQAKESWFRKFLKLPNGIPSHDTFGRVFSLLSPEEFQRCFTDWVRSLSGSIEGVVAIDGKTLRRSHDRASGRAAIHMVSAWASANRLVLGQVKTEEKSNEITAIPVLLRGLDIHGCLVTIDAMGCQRGIAEQIIEQGGDYLLALKGNQSTLAEAVELLFTEADEVGYRGYDVDYYETDERQHGRHEIRRYWAMPCAGVCADTQKWRKLTTIGMVESHRTVRGETSIEHRYYIGSFEPNAQTLATAVRHHWGIENGLHWVLDVAFREDDSRVRKDHAPANFAILRHIAVNLAKKETTAKIGVKNKRLKAAWDESYLATLLMGA